MDFVYFTYYYPEQQYQHTTVRCSLLPISSDFTRRAAITYFLPDKKKSGGEYITATGNVKKIDSVQREVFMLNGARIPVDDILDIAGDLFKTSYQ